MSSHDICIHNCQVLNFKEPERSYSNIHPLIYGIIVNATSKFQKFTSKNDSRLKEYLKGKQTESTQCGEESWE